MVSVVFAGQGSQEKAMGRALAESWEDSLHLWKLAEKYSGAPLREIFWEGDAEAMSQTQFQQPAITVVNISLFAKMVTKFKPDCVAGHSLGEFSALYAAGAIEAEELIKLVCLRGQLMGQVKSEGKMVAVLKLAQEDVLNIVNTVNNTNIELFIANYNTQEQFVLSGSEVAIKMACDLVKEKKGRAIVLAVSGAFHSPYMQEAADEFTKVLKKNSWKKIQIPLYPNCSAEAENNILNQELNLQKHMTSSVLWSYTIQNQFNCGVRTFYEIAPKSILTKMTSQILSDTNCKIKAITKIEDI